MIVSFSLWSGACQVIRAHRANPLISRNFKVQFLWHTIFIYFVSKKCPRWSQFTIRISSINFWVSVLDLFIALQCRLVWSVCFAFWEFFSIFIESCFLASVGNSLYKVKHKFVQLNEYCHKLIGAYMQIDSNANKCILCQFAYFIPSFIHCFVLFDCAVGLNEWTKGAKEISILFLPGTHFVE